MHKLLRRLLLFDRFEIRTKQPREEVLAKIESLLNNGYGEYYGRVSERGFLVGDKPIKSFGIGRMNNSFAPIARASVVEVDGETVITGILRMNLPVLIIFIPIYLGFLYTLLLFPVAHIMLHFFFFRPAKRLREVLEGLLTPQ